jgi:hypothetical protein
MDMGGQEKCRKEWMEHVVIFVVDGADKEHEEEARSELYKLGRRSVQEKSRTTHGLCQ